MKATINNSLISQLKPENKQYDVRDTKLIGFLIRVNPSGRMTYVCEYKRGRRINLGGVGVLTPAQARDRAKEILGDAIKGIDPGAKKKQIEKLKLSVFIENEYKPWVLAHRKSGIKTIARINRCFCKPFGTKDLADITPIIIDQWRTQRLNAGKSIETINRDVATFKAALAKAVEWGFIDSHPLGKLKLFKVDNAIKVRYLNIEEENCLRKVLNEREEQLKAGRERANVWRKQRSYNVLTDLREKNFVDYIKPMVLVSINTGIRQGELFNLDRKHIDFSRKILTIAGETAKSGKTRYIPLNEEAFNILSSWCLQTSPTGLVFQSKAGKKFDNVRKAWLSVLRKAKINDFRWHDMRHHFASRLVMAGVDLNTVRELLGHSDIKMTLRYAHLAPEHKAEAVARLMRPNTSLLAA